MALRRSFLPLLDRVLVERVAAKESIGGVFIPESARSKLNEGVVVATGPGGRDRDGKTIPIAVKTGDKVLLPEFGGNTIKVDDKEFVLFRDEDILAVIQDK